MEDFTICDNEEVQELVRSLNKFLKNLQPMLAACAAEDILTTQQRKQLAGDAERLGYAMVPFAEITE